MDTENKSKKRRRGKPFLVILILIVLIAASGGYYMATLNKALEPGSDRQLIVEIPAGSGTEQIAQILEDKGVITSAAKFRLKSRMSDSDGKFKAGVYEVTPGMTIQEIIDLMVSGSQNQRRLTIQEGLTLEQTAEAVEKAGICTKDEFLQETQNGQFDYRFMEYAGAGEKRLEGFLYPETYYIQKGMTAHDVIDLLLAQFDKIFTDEFYERAAEIGRNPREIVTIASMIQRETLAESEGAKVASVIYNRLRDGMRLQIDATVQYALGEQKDRLTYSDLEVESPYNTYLVDGLPAGPICEPHESSIRAALWPENTDYYYYVLKPDGSGQHNFASTSAEFERYRTEYIDSLS